MKKFYLDFETRSECDLKKCGAVVYAQHPSTRLMCMSYALGTKGAVKRALPTEDSVFPTGVFTKRYFKDLLHVGDPDVRYVAHNISFERAILKYVLGIETPLEQWEDTAAIARFQSLPGSLANLGEYFGEPKDATGNRTMMKLSKPRSRSSKANPDKYWERSVVPEDFEALYDYCDTDVVIMQSFNAAMRPMTPYERKTWLLTERIAERGIYVDNDALQQARAVIAKETARIKAKVLRATGGISATQTAKLAEWLGLPNLQKATVEDAFNWITDPKKRYAMMARQAVGLVSIKKLESLHMRRDVNGLVHHSLIYAGAERTGRWSGSGIQPQNFPRGTGGKKLDAIFEALQSGKKIKNAHATLSQALKGFIIGRGGRPLLVGDYSQIECRVLAWLAGQQDLLDVFATGGDPYCVMAETVYHYPVNKHDHPEERQLGKAIILGCGYGMGGPKFSGTAHDMYGLEVEEDRAQELVNIYRETYPRIVQFWKKAEKAFRACVQRVNEVKLGALTFRGDGESVSVELPSTRKLYYNRARVVMGSSRDRYGQGVITYYGKNTMTGKYSGGEHTYGGKLVENITQAVARDVMAEAMQRVESQVLPIILTVHDEVVAECPRSVLDTDKALKTFVTALEQRPVWAQDLPLAVEAAVHMRYQK